MVLVKWIQKKSIAQLSSNESALHVQKESHLKPFVVLRKTNKKRPPKISNFAVRLVLRPTRSYLIVLKPWMVSWNVLPLVYPCHNVIVLFLFFFFKGCW